MTHLPETFWTMPKFARTTLTTKELRETLMATDGWLGAAGYVYDLKSKRIGPGVYSVFLEKRK